MVCKTLKNWLLSFENRIMRQNEVGLTKMMYSCIDKAARASCRSSKIALYETVDEYTKEHEGFSDLIVANFRFLFLNFFIFCFLVLVAFWAHRLVIYGKEKKKKRKKKKQKEREREIKEKT